VGDFYVIKRKVHRQSLQEFTPKIDCESFKRRPLQQQTLYNDVMVNLMNLCNEASGSNGSSDHRYIFALNTVMHDPQLSLNLTHINPHLKQMKPKEPHSRSLIKLGFPCLTLVSLQDIQREIPTEI
jgi:hypothetical protein